MSFTLIFLVLSRRFQTLLRCSYAYTRGRTQEDHRTEMTKFQPRSSLVARAVTSFCRGETGSLVDKERCLILGRELFCDDVLYCCPRRPGAYYYFPRHLHSFILRSPHSTCTSSILADMVSMGPITKLTSTSAGRDVDCNFNFNVNINFVSSNLSS
ncbi:hypothetical protein GALMADRAFT_1051429 [Galerina marginata CBS 339.88]|uniref:Secreted protein n=1 Tax=Galerina marginata (strain CBS 339.88) TaxID=685588 RepID=A0A067SAY8_GALM3|nr:hypothetical protein GALMADRAFT_1051429 [Galerina marginata CBS 339.88]